MAKRTFHYHASAHALSGHFWRPFQRVIEVQAATTLPSIGGVGNSRVDNFRLDNLVSCKAAYTHVQGSEVEVTEKGRSRITHTTHVISTVERLNILDVVTADRIVARLTSVHDAEDEKAGGEPRIIMIGSRFENLRIAGCDVYVHMHHKVFLPFDTFGAVCDLPEGHEFLGLAADTVNAIDSEAKFKKTPPKLHGALLSSLVKEVNFKCLDEGQDVCAGVTRYGRHRFHVRDFGNIFLGEVLFQHGQKTLTMLRVELGSPNGAGLIVVQASSDGQPMPPGGR